MNSLSSFSFLSNIYWSSTDHTEWRSLVCLVLTLYDNRVMFRKKRGRSVQRPNAITARSHRAWESVWKCESGQREVVDNRQDYTRYHVLWSGAMKLHWYRVVNRRGEGGGGRVFREQNVSNISLCSGSSGSDWLAVAAHSKFWIINSKNRDFIAIWFWIAMEIFNEWMIRKGLITQVWDADYSQGFIMRTLYSIFVSSHPHPITHTGHG